ncbi:MAG TPA: allantoinase AllB [Catalimonadaceae bacterium]|nr:allantoinase AllB [Catalimonadaceae bacterium]
MAERRMAIKSNRITHHDKSVSGQILIESGRILDVVSRDEPLDASWDTMDLPDPVCVSPGFIDCHVHINEPGRTHWEGFDSATRAAAAGGLTSLIEMPLNASPVTTTAENFDLKAAATTGNLHVNCGFWGGLVPDNLFDLEEMLDRGVFGLKAFLTHSGIDEFPNTSDVHLRSALQILKKYNRPLLVHCELESENPDAHLLAENPRNYAAYLKSRPKAWENDAIDLVIRLCRETGSRVHIVHLSSAEALPAIRKAKAEGLPLTVETCPHYIVFNAEDIGDGQTQFKCAPPIREKANNELLWEALLDGTIDFLGSDHSPAPPDLKQTETGNFQKAWGGIAGLQFLMPAFWTEAKKRGFSEPDLVRLLSSAPSVFCGLDTRKGKIAPGADADLVIWNPEASFTLTTDQILHRHKVCPYLGNTMSGVVEKTIVGGETVFDSGRFLHLAQGSILYPS